MSDTAADFSYLIDQIDSKKDYYNDLGVTVDATAEELKTAYIQLALIHHPDRAEDESEESETFIKISEAWSILSRPEVRTRYDQLRGRFLGLSSFGGQVTLTHEHMEINPGYNTQKDNFVRVQAKASSNWQEIRSKYKNENWQKLPLSERKMKRARPAKSMPMAVFGVLLPLLCIGGATYGMHYVSQKSFS
ncbi:DnaJ domain-containing protein [Ochromonadaceae sp. CCMP2298]|nr:DnaJ domain-containing protein [Ochromonadaceae sp. CCMP2298]|mmetsp:Transcript_34224/g.75403  ORF Transcript_34224/g.75403 Transcript_34224/m.75403 type:complete len:191 (+) Transcript_34224:195-767(+)|eukprot:CAMPEP_0173203462 /NCGR_PEP_ID=MMETSP1141-20130122/19530_1 /TAXON_ID=483371 /ORGANISM="non described non described, Strain CCMP2298" /LENGTH=190 /DNA_ID=CAMNT_0014128917 /DNA_START=100 /DNA_END=672 /DNA_ORIENTATION=+